MFFRSFYPERTVISYIRYKRVPMLLPAALYKASLREGAASFLACRRGRQQSCACLKKYKALEPPCKEQRKYKSYGYVTKASESNANFTTVENQKKVNKKVYTSYSKLSEVKLLTIGIASPLRILQWAEKTLPNGKIYGEVLNANTLHHKTFKPQKGGLFCERIFGPLKDFECACGKVDKSVKQEFSKNLFRSSVNNLSKKEYAQHQSGKEQQALPLASSEASHKIKTVRKFCPECDVEYTWSVIRRYQLGYIKLISPVTHIWFLKGTPSYLSLLLDIKKRHLQYVTYCSETLTLENAIFINNKGLFLDSPSKIFSSWQNIVSSTPSTPFSPAAEGGSPKEPSFGAGLAAGGGTRTAESGKAGGWHEQSFEKKEEGRKARGSEADKNFQMTKDTTYNKTHSFSKSYISRPLKAATPQKEWKINILKFNFSPIFTSSEEDSYMNSPSLYDRVDEISINSWLDKKFTGVHKVRMPAAGKVEAPTKQSQPVSPLPFQPPALNKVGYAPAFGDKALEEPSRRETFGYPYRQPSARQARGGWHEQSFGAEGKRLLRCLANANRPLSKEAKIEFSFINEGYKENVLLSKYEFQKNLTDFSSNLAQYQSNTSTHSGADSFIAAPVSFQSSALALPRAAPKVGAASSKSEKSVFGNTFIYEQIDKYRQILSTELNTIKKTKAALAEGKAVLAASFGLLGKKAGGWKGNGGEGNDPRAPKAGDINMSWYSFLSAPHPVERKHSEEGMYSRRAHLINKLQGSFSLVNLLCGLQLSLGYNSLMAAEGEVKPKDLLENQTGLMKRSSWTLLKNPTKLAPMLHSIYNKLPVDLYIICTLEQRVHKEALVLAIKQTWNSMYKQAYFKAMCKALKITTKYEYSSKSMKNGQLTYFSNPNLKPLEKSSFVPFQPVPKQSPFGGRRSPFGKAGTAFGGKHEQSVAFSKAKLWNRKETEEAIFNKYMLIQSKRNIKNYAYKASIKKIEKVLKTLKISYRQHVLNTLRNLKQPIFAYKYSTSFKHNNSQIISALANDISNILSFDTEWMVDLLMQAFLKPLIFGKYLENFKLINNKYSEGKYAEGCSEARGAEQPPDREQEQADTRSSVTAVLQLYANFLRLKKNSQNNENFSVERSFLGSKAVPPLPFLYKKMPSCAFVDKGNGLAASLQAVQGRINKKFKDSYSHIRRKQSGVVFWEDRKGQKDSKYKIYNNIYTLSHRERWDTEKDWYIFLLFNSASIDHLDTPIFAYKSRLFSQTNEFDFIQPFTASQGSSAAKAGPTQNNGNYMSSHSITRENSTYLNKYSSAFYSGPGIVKQLLNEFDFNEIKKLDKQNRLLLYQLNKYLLKLKKHVQIFVYDKAAKVELKELCQKRDLLIRRTKLVRKLFRKDSDPSSMIITVLPVLPPDLRPIVKMGGQIAASDLNRLYQRVIYRNERLKKFLKDPATSNSYEMKYAQRLLQEAVDNLIQNGKSGMNSEKDARGRALKSLSDSLKGKQGRFRQFLLGKRVDYSGRSVIVVGPKLKLHECGLPIEMAKELYLPFLLKSILNKNYAKTVIGAKALIKKNAALTAELLREIMQVSPVLLNRAPTLHRLGFQAFVPKLIEGRAILLHPLVCSAFNADFDGDQMAVHVPITVEARAEAWKLMLSRNNILSPATGDPLAIPSQDMVLGCYYLTTYSNKKNIPLLKGSGLFFNNLQDVMRAYEQQKIHVHALVWVKWTGFIENGSDQEEPVEIRLSNDGQWQEISSNYHRIYNPNNLLINQYMATTPGRIFFNTLIQQNITNS